MSDLEFDSGIDDGTGLFTPMEDTAFDYMPEGDLSVDSSPITSTEEVPHEMDYSGPEPSESYEGPGAIQTTYGQHPWGPGGGGGYIPMSQSRTDDNPLGSSEAQRRLAVQQPSNAAIDPETIYDRTSYEYASGDVVGSGIFDMEEGVTFNQSDGIFANNYALPGYLAREPMMYPAQSAMIDTQTGLPTVVQPSASGVQLAMQVPPGTPVYSPFRQTGPQFNRTPVPRVPNVPPPRGMGEVAQPSRHVSSSSIENFGREVASELVRRAALLKVPEREKFVSAAMAMLGPQRSRRAIEAIQHLVRMGYPSTHVVEQVFAHCVMHAVAVEVAGVARTGRAQPPATSSVRALTAAVPPDAHGRIAQAARSVAPALMSKAQAERELKQYVSSDTRQRAVAMLGDDGAQQSSSMSTGTKVAIGIGVAGAAFAAWKYRDKLFGGR